MKGLDGVDGGPGDGLAGGHYYVVQRCVTRRPTGSEGPRSQDYSESRDERATEQGPRKQCTRTTLARWMPYFANLPCRKDAGGPEDTPKLNPSWHGMKEA